MADDLCREGELLALPASEELASFRQWYVDAIADQLAGGDGPAVCPFTS
jgi:hypothetical protein